MMPQGLGQISLQLRTDIHKRSRSTDLQQCFKQDAFGLWQGPVPLSQQVQVDLGRQGAQNSLVVLVVDQQPRRCSAVIEEHLEKVQSVIRQLLSSFFCRRLSVVARVEKSVVGRNDFFTEATGQFQIGLEVPGLVAFKIEVRHPPVSTQGRNPEVMIPLIKGVDASLDIETAKGRSEGVAQSICGLTWVEVPHESPTARFVFLFCEADMEVEGGVPGVTGVNDGR